MNLIEQAKQFATLAHQSIGQKRKFTNDPYITHPAAVVELLMQINPTPEMICAAWLHDTVEDTLVTLDNIEQTFGNTVASYVEMLTDVQTRKFGGERIHRKNTNLMHSAQACAEAQSIKLCDLIDNSKTVVEHDPFFACDYLLEMKRLLVVLTKGHPALYLQACKQSDDAITQLNNVLGDDCWYQKRWEVYDAHLSLEKFIIG
ncbi:GTP pyrophosphokinase [Brenneria roseae subsp. americana]|uniref:GTP pyrophosphokinase n=1 Tax=Brenneria roseae subsp. americana TaxID=1508507 RepID=A0A2U1TY69_9GAMM|nr:HD domain-containing protein [Brenneria roseae]PWC14357.1 GTP pyrophosphokinase [Brenneria roseae subsp. americana]